MAKGEPWVGHPAPASGGGTGMDKVTGDMTKIAAQVPALFEALSGMKMSELMKNVKPMKEREDSEK